MGVEILADNDETGAEGLIAQRERNLFIVRFQHLVLPLIYNMLREIDARYDLHP